MRKPLRSVLVTFWCAYKAQFREIGSAWFSQSRSTDTATSYGSPKLNLSCKWAKRTGTRGFDCASACGLANILLPRSPRVQRKIKWQTRETEAPMNTKAVQGHTYPEIKRRSEKREAHISLSTCYNLHNSTHTHARTHTHTCISHKSIVPPIWHMQKLRFRVKRIFQGYLGGSVC